MPSASLPGFSSANIGAGYSPDEVDFLRAISTYQQTRHRPFPTWSEVLSVLTSLGYRRVAEPGPLPPLPRRNA